MKIYLDTNVFYNAYSPVEESEICDWILEQLDTDFVGVTSEWTIIEMFRALKKQVNLEVIDEEEASIALTYFLAELGEFERNGKLITLPVTRKSIMGSRKLIFEKNIYSADALHLFQAIDNGVNCFLTFDNTLRSRITELSVINPMLENFREQIISLKNK